MFQDPREPGLAEHTDVWECEEQSFRENDEQEGQMAGLESREGKRMERKKEARLRLQENNSSP